MTTEVQNIMTVTAACLTLGVVCGGLVFSVRFLWRLFQRLLGSPTWRE